MKLSDPSKFRGSDERSDVVLVGAATLTSLGCNGPSWSAQHLTATIFLAVNLRASIACWVGVKFYLRSGSRSPSPLPIAGSPQRTRSCPLCIWSGLNQSEQRGLALPVRILRALRMLT
ncbi:MAG: hypothetical protein QOH48_358 [Actinomycetota bacterium]|jgi:hypothetical protein|nr:hypothetical protein [Actinomycetota bacterium]